MTIPIDYYWKLKNPDVGMQKFGKAAAEQCVKLFEALIQEICKSSYANNHEQTTLDMSNQRLDFLCNVYEQICIMASSKLDELNEEVEQRRIPD